MADPDPGAPATPVEANSQVILVLRNLLSQRYPALGEHVNTVAELCEAVATEVGLPDCERGALVQAAWLHDIGKLSLPESLLNDSGSLTDAEWRLMRLHTIVGKQILVAAGLCGPAVEFVRSSHEHYDGNGYPDGLVGEEIPLGARIIAVCDAFEAMTSSRPYRPVPMSIERACRELMRSSDTQFDRAVARAVTRSVLRKKRGAPDANYSFVIA